MALRTNHALARPNEPGRGRPNEPGPSPSKRTRRSLSNRTRRSPSNRTYPLDDLGLWYCERAGWSARLADLLLALKEPAALERKGAETRLPGPLALIEALLAQGRKGLSIQRYKGAAR
jgi:hypothetical protein